jgi:hypothetical protein
LTFPAEDVSGLRERHGTLEFSDARSGDRVVLGAYPDGQAQAICERLGARFPEHVRPTVPVLYSSRFRLNEEPDRLVLDLTPGPRDGPPFLFLGLVGATVVGVQAGSVGAGLLTFAVGFCAVGGVRLASQLRRERVVFTATGCEISSDRLRLLRRSYQPRGLRLECRRSETSNALLFDDVRTGRSVRCAEDLAWEPALRLVLDTVVARFPALAEPPGSLPLARVKIAGSRLTFGKETLHLRDPEVTSLRLAPPLDARGTTAHGPQLLHGVELTRRSGEPQRLFSLLDETESLAVLARLREAWPEVEVAAVGVACLLAWAVP